MRSDKEKQGCHLTEPLAMMSHLPAAGMNLAASNNKTN
jgi:hypothetical protein